MIKLELLAFDGFEELDLVGPYEVLEVAAKSGAPFDVSLVTVDGPTMLTAAHGMVVEVQGRLSKKPDVLVIPGGGWNARGKRGAWAEVHKKVVPQAIAALHGQGTVIASVCTGAMLVAAAGLAAGRVMATHYAALDDLKAAGAEVVRARVVDDGDIISAGGVTSGLDLALYLVERFSSPAIAVRVEESIEYERRGAVWKKVAPPPRAGSRAR
jgi:transcriptional regulator GlxA family with amidase domain